VSNTMTRIALAAADVWITLLKKGA